jgi:hypothetical protein
MTCLQHAGLSHSEICGSMVICTSPQLFAAYRVLLRLRGPRHPPCALLSLCFVFAIRNPSRGTGCCAPRIPSRVAEGVLSFALVFFTLCCTSCQISPARQPLPLREAALRAVENNGFEPLTPCLQSRCSSQLS